MRPSPLLLASSFALLVACASTQAPAGPRVERDVLTAEQLSTSSYATAFDALEALRINWLKPRGTDSFRSPSTVVVYLDNVKLGGVETLRTLQLPSIRYIRHYDSSRANARWGLGHGAGVIQVVTLAEGSPSSPPAAR